MHRGQLVETAHCILVPRLQYDDHFRWATDSSLKTLRLLPSHQPVVQAG